MHIHIIFIIFISYLGISVTVSIEIFLPMHVSDYTSSVHTGFAHIWWAWRPSRGLESGQGDKVPAWGAVRASAKAQRHSWTDGFAHCRKHTQPSVLWQSLPSFCSHTQQCAASWLPGEFCQGQAATGTQGRAISISSQEAIQRGMKLSVTAQKRALRAKQTGCYSWCVEKFSSSFPLQYA